MTGPLEVQLDVRALRAFEKRVERYRGAPLALRMEKGAIEAARLLVPPIRANTPVGPTGNLRRSIRAGQSRGGGFRGSTVATATAGNIRSAYVGPAGRLGAHRHLVIRGHRIVTPGGRDTGRRTLPNPFVDEAVQPRAAAAIRDVSAAIFGGP